MKFQLKNAFNRKQIDLRDFSKEIGLAVTHIFNIDHIAIYQNYFEIIGISNAEYQKRRNLGREIAKLSPALNACKKQYGNSIQLFVSIN